MLAVTLPELLVPNNSGPRCSITYCLATACTVLLSALPLPWFCLCQPVLSKITNWHHLGDSRGYQQFPLGNVDTAVLAEAVGSVLQQHFSRLCTQAGQSASFFTQSTAVTRCVRHFELNKRDTELDLCFILQRLCGRPRRPAKLQMQPACAILPESQRMARAPVLFMWKT